MSRIDQALTRGAGTPDVKESLLPDDPWGVVHPVVPATEEPRPVPMAPPVARESAPLIQPEPALVSPGLAERVVGARMPPAVIEEYRRLGAILHHMQTERGTRAVMVTSAVAGEGKTLSAVNLALTLSGSYGRNVLLIDADLRRPSLDRVFNTVVASGLGDMLRDPAVTPPLVQVNARLTLLLAGRADSDPLGGLTSERMRQLLDEAKQTFDFVIIDTPPVGLLTDANLLASMVDVTFLVVRAESTPYDLVKRAGDAIGKHRIAGVILNRATTSHHEVGSYSDYYGRYASPRQG